MGVIERYSTTKKVEIGIVKFKFIDGDTRYMLEIDGELNDSVVISTEDYVLLKARLGMEEVDVDAE